MVHKQGYAYNIRRDINNQTNVILCDAALHQLPKATECHWLGLKHCSFAEDCEVAGILLSLMLK